MKTKTKTKKAPPVVTFTRESQAMTWARAAVRRSPGAEVLPVSLLRKAWAKVAKAAWKARKSLDVERVARFVDVEVDRW